MKIHKPDGVIEFDTSGCCCPPNQIKKGMHTNSTTQWFRVNSGEWLRDFYRNNTLILAEAAVDCADFRNDLEKRKQYGTSL